MTSFVHERAATSSEQYPKSHAKILGKPRNLLGIAPKAKLM